MFIVRCDAHEAFHAETEVLAHETYTVGEGRASAS